MSSTPSEKKSLLFDLALFRKVWRLALPVIMTNLLQTLVLVADTFMVGRLGPLSLAAVGMANSFAFLVLVLILSVAGGAMSLIAQAKGGRDPQRMSFVTRQSISSGVLLSIILGVFGYFSAAPLLSLINSEGNPEVVLMGSAYLQIIFLGTPFLVLNAVMNRLMQGAGDTLTPLVLTGTLNVFNILFNYLFIFGWGPVPAFGIDGAALGTMLSRALGVLAGFLIFFSGKNVVKILPGSWWPDWSLVKDILSIGVPSGVQGVFRRGLIFILIGVVTATELGTYGAAVIAICLQVESIAIQPVVGINVAGTSLVGQAIGKWQTHEAYYKGNVTIILGVVVMTILIVPIIIFAPQIIKIFDPSNHPLVAKGGIEYLRINTLALPVSAVAIILTGNLRGAGDTQPAMLAVLLRSLLTLLLACSFVFWFNTGSKGVWLALVIGRISECIAIYAWWVRRKWFSVALQKTEIYRTHLQFLSLPLQKEFLDKIRAPLMAASGTVEKVSAKHVTYYHPKKAVQVNFTKEGYYTAPTQL